MLITNREEIIKWFLSHCNIQHYTAKSTLINANTPAESLYYIIDGSVTALAKDNDGKEIILSYLNKGDFFGEMAMFSDAEERTAWIKARTNTQIGKISYKKFYQLIQVKPDILVILTQQIVDRLRITSKQVSDLAFLDVTGRVAQLLLKLSLMPDAMTHPKGMQIKITRQEIGQMVGCSRETAGRVLKTLESQNLIEAHGKTIVVYDMAYVKI